MEPALGLQPWREVLIFASLCRVKFLSPHGTSLSFVFRSSRPAGFPPAASAFRCPAFVPGRFSCAMNWAILAVHPCLFLVLEHGRTIFSV